MQFSTLRFGITALALGALGSLLSCSKEDTQDIAPSSASATAQNARGISETAQTLNWQQFITEVEAGKRVDAFGQYVSKETRVISNGRARIVRPKREVALKAGSGTGGTVESKYVQPDEPCDGCGGGGGYYPPPYTFVTSENLGASPYYPSNYILDLKLVTDSNSSWLYPGHIRLNSDLNKGAGGDYIYLTFTRQGDYGSSPLTRVSILTRSFGQPGSWPDQHQPIWYGQYNATTNTFNTYDSQLDLNSGAGGDYIFAYAARETSFGAPIREVGVLSSRNQAQQPPAGWERVGVDLNKGAGGDYIYVCVKR
ncbi:hypothetical protein [Hymenobacter lucidus]|uniref:MABP domain-containing protein n=1 Tax=Hymenobacter lucidus TaxID=2880930 RepID=A0ABS8AWT3_9BACT|nr:hypothetical protein [Hymenobacter lucidus]MCB2410265.1 hypothetical protein [Hymenobacter lucidus]